LKKVVLILSLVMLMGMGVANAEITRGQDSFSGGVTINSVTNTSDPTELDQLVFRKCVNTSPSEYELWANRITSKEFLFTNTFIELRIDNNSTRKITITKNGIISLADGYKKYSHITVPLSIEFIEQIKSAQRVALRFQTMTGSYVYILPDPVLAEWKEVINTEK